MKALQGTEFVLDILQIVALASPDNRGWIRHPHHAMCSEAERYRLRLYPLQEVCDPWDESCAKDSRCAHSLEECVRTRTGHALGELIELLQHALQHHCRAEAGHHMFFTL